MNKIPGSLFFNIKNNLLLAAFACLFTSNLFCGETRPVRRARSAPRSVQRTDLSVTVPTRSLSATPRYNSELSEALAACQTTENELKRLEAIHYELNIELNKITLHLMAAQGAPRQEPNPFGAWRAFNTLDVGNRKHAFQLAHKEMLKMLTEKRHLNKLKNDLEVQITARAEEHARIYKVYEMELQRLENLTKRLN